MIYIGSFSKTLLPTLRLGFVVTPPSLRAAVHKAKYVTDWHTSMLAQATLARFIEDGWFARHLRRALGVYRERHALVMHALSNELRRHLEMIPSDAGFARRRAGSQALTRADARSGAPGIGRRCGGPTAFLILGGDIDAIRPGARIRSSGDHANQGGVALARDLL